VSFGTRHFWTKENATQVLMNSGAPNASLAMTAVPIRLGRTCTREHEVERAAAVEVRYVALQPLDGYRALAKL
jgi:thiamine monophosphate synthase